jgi:hypothetical protein
MQQNTLAVSPMSVVTILFDIMQVHEPRLRVLFSEYGIQEDSCRLVDDNTKYAFDTPAGWTKHTDEELRSKLATLT